MSTAQPRWERSTHGSEEAPDDSALAEGPSPTSATPGSAPTAAAGAVVGGSVAGGSVVGGGGGDDGEADATTGSSQPERKGESGLASHHSATVTHSLQARQLGVIAMQHIGVHGSTVVGGGGDGEADGGGGDGAADGGGDGEADGGGGDGETEGGGDGEADGGGDGEADGGGGDGDTDTSSLMAAMMWATFWSSQSSYVGS